MAKKQSAAKTKSAAKKPTTGIKHKLGAVWHKHWQLISFSVLILGVLGFIGVQQLLVYNQRQQFKAAEQSLEALSNDIIAATGQPTEVKKDASCGYASAKFEKGTLGCGFSFVLIYNVNSANEANTIKDKATNVVRRENVTYLRDYIFKDSENSRPSTNPAADFTCNTSVNCGYDIRYTDPMDTGNNYLEAHQITISIHGGGNAKAEFYPVKN